MKQRGFTVIELLVVTVVFIVLGLVFWNQYNDVQAIRRDDQRRSAINAMYYNLEDIFYATNKYYPKTIDETKLTAMDKANFTDPDGHKLGTAESTYRYLPTNCTGEKCTGYTLRTTLEKEADFIKSNRE